MTAAFNTSLLPGKAVRWHQNFRLLLLKALLICGITLSIICIYYAKSFTNFLAKVSDEQRLSGSAALLEHKRKYTVPREFKEVLIEESADGRKLDDVQHPESQYDAHTKKQEPTVSGKPENGDNFKPVENGGAFGSPKSRSPKAREIDVFRIEEEKSLFPQFYFPFSTGQSDGEHTLGVQIINSELPRGLSLFSEQLEHQLLNGIYNLLMADDEKPHLFHGRPIWKSNHSGESQKQFHIYFDHDNHRWVINDELRFQDSEPFAWMQHSAALPISSETAASHLRRHAIPEGVHWNVRGNDIDAGDSTMRLNIKPIESLSLPSLAMQLNKLIVENELDFDEDNDEDIDDHEDEDEDGIDATDTDNGLDKEHGIFNDFGAMGLPRNEAASTLPQLMYWSFISPEVYHTFETKHTRFDHDSIYNDPIGHLKANGFIT